MFMIISKLKLMPLAFIFLFLQLLLHSNLKKN